MKHAHESSCYEFVKYLNGLLNYESLNLENKDAVEVDKWNLVKSIFVTHHLTQIPKYNCSFILSE